MKKFYAMIAAALMSVSVFAGGTPSSSDLAGFMEAGYYVVCFSVPAAETCNDIVWIGTYDGWNEADPDKIKCEELTGFSGWYVAKVPVAENNGENSGKPVQLNECGKFDWMNQCGYYGTIEKISGDVDIAQGGDYTDAGGTARKETDLKNWSTTEPTIISMSAWKSSPCGKVCDEHPYEIRLFDPFCESHPEFLPYMRGNFNAWGPAVPMTLRDTVIDGDDASVYVYVTEPLSGNLLMKWNNSSEKDNWGNQFQVFYPEDTENDVDAHWDDLYAGTSNFDSNADLTGVSFVKKINNYTFEFDLSDNTKYRYGQCVPKESFTINLTAPEGAPAEIEIVGSFISWDNGVVMTPAAGGLFTATVEAQGTDEFKIRSKGSWDVQLQKYDETEQDWANMGNLKFGELANAGVIDLDFSDAEVYRWSSAAGIETVGLTKHAQKVIVDGVLYIVRDNKMFSVQGTQVR